ncbi:MAG: helix-turn-helix domain-containing protein [Gammaproteobacteria bacterium]|nr:helix-turn-helix domain-containing protein [Gammaproteobacteria bacterium]
MKKLNNTIKTQRLRLLRRLQEGPCTTTEARHKLDILGVAPRVHELRYQYGFNIKTLWTDDHNPGGGRHRVAKYVLMQGKWTGGTYE